MGAVEEIVAFDLRVAAFSQVSLVVGGDDWNPSDADFLQDAHGGLDHLVHVRVGRVDHVDQEVSVLGFLQGCLKRVDQVVGQLGDEADRVGQDKGEALVQVDPADGSVQGREEHVFGKNLLVAVLDAKDLEQAVHCSRLAGIGVADQGHFRQAALVAAGCFDVFLAGDVFELVLDGRDLLADGPPVHFQLGFPGPTVGKAAAS